MNSSYLSEKEYGLILKTLPISTVDYVVTRNDNGVREFLLVKRASKPYLGEWFIPGGRILRGETLEQTLKRKLKIELGILKYTATFIGCQTLLNPPGPLGVRQHSIWHMFEVALTSPLQLKVSEENSAVQWFSKIQKNWPTPVQKCLRAAGFK